MSRSQMGTRKLPEPSTSQKVAGRPVTLRVNRRARRLIVKVHPATGEISVVAPSRSALPHALRFARAQEEWITHRLTNVPELVPVAPGSLIPFLGVEHAIEIGHAHIASVSIQPGNVIRVDGSTRHAERRLREFLRTEAKRVLEARSLAFAVRIGASLGRVSVRDAKGRWGSCSRSGAISYSWRLVLAPPFVLDYVVAHEVAHLREMHHGPKFWAIVRALVGECREARLWLRRNGVSLHRYLTSQAGS